MGGYILSNNWLIKPSSVVYNKLRACQLTEITKYNLLKKNWGLEFRILHEGLSPIFVIKIKELNNFF